MVGEPLAEEEAVRIAHQICKALLELHQATPMIVYRDLKTENIMLTSDEKVKLIDFNISRSYQEGKKRDRFLIVRVFSYITTWFLFFLVAIMFSSIFESIIGL